MNNVSIYRDSDLEPSSDVQDEAEVSSDLQSVSSANSDSDTSEDDQKAEDSDVGSDCLIFPVSLEAADDVCAKLDQLVRSGSIPKDGIFYKQIKDVVYFSINPRTHQYDDEVVEFFKTIRYLGGESTAKFVRGPGWHGQGRKGKGHFESETKRRNFHGPSAATCAKRQAGYTVKSGILRDLVTTTITLADKSTNVKPLVHTPIAKVLPVAITNDGTALKAGLRFDECISRVVGLNVDVDLTFTTNNPKPTAEILNQAVVTEASVSFLTTLDNEVAMPCSVEYMPKAGKTGDYMTAKFKLEAKTTQICQGCLSRVNTVEHINMDPDSCDRFCKECWHNKIV